MTVKKVVESRGTVRETAGQTEQQKTTVLYPDIALLYMATENQQGSNLRMRLMPQPALYERTTIKCSKPTQSKVVKYSAAVLLTCVINLI